MKKLLGYLLFVFVLFSCFATNALAQSTDVISEFKSNITLEQNTDIKVEEEITYFFSYPGHGIYRDIPTKYSVQLTLARPIAIKLDELYYYKKDEPSIKYSAYEKSLENGYTRFRIGEADTSIEGEYVYVIKYTMKNAVNYFDDHDELYINIAGNYWNVPIQKLSTSIKVPGKIINKICYTGVSGSKESNCTFKDISETETSITLADTLDIGEDLTVAISMPKGTLKDVRGAQTVAFLLSNIGLLLPIPTLIVGLILIKKNGKDRKLTTIPHYEPPKDMFPMLAGAIYNKALTPKHITAQIVQMAIDGYIKIKQEGKRNYVLEKDQIEKNISEDTVRALYADLFKGKNEVNINDIPSDFYTTVNSLKKSIDTKLYEEKYFSKESKKLWNKFLFIGFFGIFVTFMAATPLASIAATGWTIGIAISSIILVILTSRIELRDTLGNKVFAELEGLRMYINTAEKHRIEFHNDPEKYLGVFEKLLPYAIIFGLEKKWAKEFEDLYKEPPSWYAGDISTFNTLVLANSISSVSRGIQTSSTPPSSHSSFGGSGFSGGSSGGGFGGGGGGRW